MFFAKKKVLQILVFNVPGPKDRLVGFVPRFKDTEDTILCIVPKNHFFHYR